MKRLSTLLLLISLRSFAQDATIFKPDSIRRVIEAVQITSSLKVEGLLNDPEWKKTKPSPGFIQIEPYQGKNPNHQTDVRVLYNKQFLYLGIVLRDSLGKKAIRATDFKRDFNYMQHDLVNLSFDGFNDRRNAMAFATNPYGVQRDFLSFDDIYYDFDWDGLWRVRTARSDSGWVAEIAIPWQTLRYP
ncbi:carbohydrate binding family 9 domain-containing protein [Spirosoma sp.]|uniref:carbohydrate binding family 9 domain-containing protein n=1 Tax=Spirosoma sp. TaxID=1899569 RepID=UPI0026081416|nr:carbohydrate binding family 9 domain-containing protein [Spirosoma sp.]MCX6214289.1 carbohydrate binding family 9 domain-containing protein [Spirosoma sp.]